MPTLTKAPSLGDLLKYELNANYCREIVTLKSGTDYPLGAVLGEITDSGSYRLSPADEVTGDEGAEVASAVLIEAVDATGGAQQGLVVARGPVVLSKAALVYDGSVEEESEVTAKLDQLTAAGLIARDTA